MTKAIRLFTALAALVLLAACGDDEKDYSGVFGQIRVSDTRELKQTAGADATQAPKGVTFTTEASWTSSIVQTRAEAPDWVSITPDHGDGGGTYTVRIVLDTNPYEEARTARIAIESGTSQIEIVVTQEGTDNPIVPFSNRITRIENRSQIYRGGPGSTPEVDWIATINFLYDDLGRVTSILLDETPENLANNIEHVITLAYGSNTLKISTSSEEFPAQTYNVTLDAAGRAVAARLEGDTEQWGFEYDAQGYCSACTLNSTETPRIACGWSGGNLTSLTAYDPSGDERPDFSYAFAYVPETTNRPQAVNLDLNALLFGVCPDMEGTDFSMGALLSTTGRLGNRSANLTATNKHQTTYETTLNPERNTITYYKTLDEVIDWSQQTDGRITQAAATRNVQLIEEDAITHIKTVVDGKGFTEVDIYTIVY